jgi:hypothetical protein
MTRQGDLLLAAAAAFDDQRSPFVTEWLAEHEVTADECYDLSLGIATIIRGYLAASPEVKKMVQVAFARSVLDASLMKEAPHD